jgi:hypothetical protein
MKDDDWDEEFGHGGRKGGGGEVDAVTIDSNIVCYNAVVLW